MTRPKKRKQLVRDMVSKERERQRKIRKLQESQSRSMPEPGWVSSEDEEDISTATGPIQEDADSEDDEFEDEVLVSEAEELEQVDESAFARLMASSIDESRCVAPQASKYPVRTVQ